MESYLLSYLFDVLCLCFQEWSGRHKAPLSVLCEHFVVLNGKGIDVLLQYSSIIHSFNMLTLKSGPSDVESP